MSRIRGVFPLFLATTFGIINGIWVFGPAFKEQQQEKDNLARKAVEVAHQSEPVEVETIRKAEAAASRSISTESALKPIQASNSWWSSLSLWAKDSSSGSKTVRDEVSRTKTEQKSNDKP